MKVTRRAPEPLLSIEELAELLQVSVKTIYQWRHRGVGPRVIKVGRLLRFDPTDVRDWLDRDEE